jgi:hypothetical protein
MSSKRATAAELHLRVPKDFAYRMMRRTYLGWLLLYPIVTALMLGITYLVPREWSEGLRSNFVFYCVIGLGFSFNEPWIGISSQSWEWYLSTYGLSLKDLKNPLSFYGTIYISTKRDTIISVEQTHWRDYPALRISWRHGRGKIKSGLVVYRLEDEHLVSETLMPRLAAWPQIATRVEASAN